jgi:hypothetical protein
MTCAFVLIKWTRRPLSQPAMPAGMPDDPELQARLDRELENLD